MRVWAVGLVGLLVASAATGGYLIRSERDGDVTSYDGPAPVAAVSPSYPVEPLDLLPDPDFPPLLASLPMRVEIVGSKPFDLRLEVPGEWIRTESSASEWKWHPPPGDVLNTYFLRVRLIGNKHGGVEAMVESRIEALADAQGVRDFHLESQDTDRFVANYVSEGHRRVTMETFVTQPGADVVFASIGLVGREVDRAGMTDLIRRISDSARVGPDYRNP